MALQYAAGVMVLPVLVGIASLGAKFALTADSTEPPSYAGSFPVAPQHDRAKKTVVVLASTHGAEITDFLPTYEILARSRSFNTYVLAPDRVVIPLVNANMAATSLDVVPHYSFAEYEVSVGVTPDLIAIPWFPDYTPERDAAVLEWVRANAGPETILLSICAGTEILADTGLLDGRIATTNVGWFRKLEPRFPTTTWVRNLRYMDDGRAITSTNLASGIDAALHAVDRLAGRHAALTVAADLGYSQTRYLDDPAAEPPSLVPFALVAANAASQLGKEQMGVLIYDGVSETALAGLIDIYTASYMADARVFAAERSAVTSRNGLAFIPRADIRTVGSLDRVVLPGGETNSSRDKSIAAWKARDAAAPVEAIHDGVGSGESAYDATIRDVARRHDAVTARAVSDTIFYAAGDLDLQGPGFPRRLTIVAGVLAAIGAASTYGFRQALRRRNRAETTARGA